MPRLVEIGIDALFEALRDTEHRALTDLMVSLLRRNAYSLDDFLLGVHSKTDSLEDLRYKSGATIVVRSPASAQSFPELKVARDLAVIVFRW